MCVRWSVSHISLGRARGTPTNATTTTSPRSAQTCTTTRSSHRNSRTATAIAPRQTATAARVSRAGSTSGTTRPPPSSTTRRSSSGEQAPRHNLPPPPAQPAFLAQRQPQPHPCPVPPHPRLPPYLFARHPNKSRPPTRTANVPRALLTPTTSLPFEGSATTISSTTKVRRRCYPPHPHPQPPNSNWGATSASLGMCMNCARARASSSRWVRHLLALARRPIVPRRGCVATLLPVPAQGAAGNPAASLAPPAPYAAACGWRRHVAAREWHVL